MTEEEWGHLTNPGPMLEFLRRNVSARKLRLFACACIADYLRFMAPPHSDTGRLQAAVAINERYADGCVSRKEWLAITRVPFNFAPWKSEDAFEEATEAATTAAGVAGWHEVANYSRIQEENHQEHQCELLRCIFGNPFRLFTLDASWLTPNVVNSAQQIYKEDQFALLPRLGEALNQIGCNNIQILSHCQDPGPHVKGCWVIDLILGKQ